MKKLFYLFITFTVLSSCSSYQKALKKPDIAEKFKEGEEMYNKGKFAKANKLFAQIVPNYRGKPQAEKLMYLYSKSFFEMKDYYLASYQFERFTSAYPQSEKVDEASFLSGKSAYMLSPVYSKDQTETREAIDKLQGFINLYPESEFLPEASLLVQELDFKLERKAYEIAKQYNKIAGYTGDYDASIKAFDNFILDFPGSVYREDAYYYKLDSAYHLAINSVLSKRQNRLESVKTHYNNYKKNYSDSERMEEADKMLEEVIKELEKYSTKS
ncbi:outer membrane protein assembly factor BamD [Xanthomarina sp. F2636L]|uniref:outer membrane protein assembly factor BamD n=1 Tax=Xanthomarina sp. F2636L TaxID=2996018 RepID=UPI00225DE140|nr:outer membrane protein assembly factor BamD [Xanthomarina sp. F2636L]MCX7552193.1 outer membrane protein assembly factor BamD [Xanthomarina sp. F2636L]